MNKYLDKKLVKEFPDLYADRYADMRVTAMCWGFDCDSGWFPLIWNLSKRIDKAIKGSPKNKRKYLKASQVKEKYATLRFYMAGENYEITEAIDAIEERSSGVCEICGFKGALIEGPWLKTLCRKHARHYLAGKKSSPFFDWKIWLLYVRICFLILRGK